MTRLESAKCFVGELMTPVSPLSSTYMRYIERPLLHESVRRSLLCIHRYLRARPRWHLIGGRAVPRHAHRHALHDLHEVAGGVVRGKEGERGAGAAGEALHLALELAAA